MRRQTAVVHQQIKGMPGRHLRYLCEGHWSAHQYVLAEIAAVGFFNERRDEADHVAVELAKALKSGGEAVQTETCPLVGPWLRCGKELERVMGIEPTLEAWEAAVLPLNYTRLV